MHFGIPDAERWPLTPKALPVSRVTCKLAVVVGACRVLLVGAEGRAGRGACAEAGVAKGRAHLTGLTAVVDRPLDVQGGGQGRALLGLDVTQEEEKENIIFKGLSLLLSLIISFT